MFVTRHHLSSTDLLHRSTDVTQPGVDARSLDAGLCSFLHSLHKRVVARIEVQRERAVYDSPVYVRAEIYLDDIIVFQHRRVT